MTDEQKSRIAELQTQGYGYKKIARLIGASENTVKSYCKRNRASDETKRPATVNQNEESKLHLTTEQDICQNCGQPVQQTPKHKKKKFCSDQCRMQWWNSHLDMVNRKANRDFVCQCCGKTFTAYGIEERKYCSRDCYINDRFGG